MIFLAIVAALSILAGMMVFSTNRIDNYWTNRGLEPIPMKRSVSTLPPFIWSEDQCVGCGRDDELLNLDRQCIYCFEKAWVND